MRIDVISVFPGLFEPYVSTSMIGLARERGLLEFQAFDLREWALPGVHRQVDDSPYGGGPGMVMRPEPFFAAVKDVAAKDPRDPFVVLLTPRGRPLVQSLVRELAMRERLMVLCGRYEGVDERVRALADLEVSIGDYVLTGGELPALVLTDAVTRLLPGVLGDESSPDEESYSDGLLEYPQYTRPASFEGIDVPPVLMSGDHARIAEWRREQAVRRTARSRPDLLGSAALSDKERDIAAEERAAAGQEKDDT